MAKTIRELTAMLPEAAVTGSTDTRIDSVEHDSRKVKAGTLFACIPGAHVDGHAFIGQAAASGAAAVLVEREVETPAGLTVIRVPNVRNALQQLVPYFYDYPAQKMRVIGITGTNGKTTTSYIIRAILRRAGFKVGLIGTIQIMVEDEVLPIHNTTPDVIDLQQTLALMQSRGIDYVVMEVSSHALDQQRVGNTHRQIGRMIEWRFDRHVINLRVEDFFEIIGSHVNHCSAERPMILAAYP